MKTPRLALDRLISVILTSFLLSTLLSAAAPAAPRYDLGRVDGINCFHGSAEAGQVLAGQGFVVAAPEFRQIFEPYKESPVPVFVTPDSAWHTYHVLLEEGVKEMERAQSTKLAAFSQRLLKASREQSAAGLPQFAALAEFASVGLAFQDRAYRQTLPDNQKRLLEALLTGTGPVASPIGFPLSPVQFRPQSFYAETPELADFYSARQWYSCVDFRLSNEQETLLALYLSWLVESDAELLSLWRQLSEPYDAFVAQPEDGTVAAYNRAARQVLGSKPAATDIRDHLKAIQSKLQQSVPAPRINDQSLTPAEYSSFAQATKGFRLLPTRQLPCEVCFQNTVAPGIPGRTCPSGLDFFAASPVLRSPAAARAVEAQFGKAVLQGVQAASCPAMPDSLYGQSMALLARLQEPLPAGVPQPLRTEAWADLQLSTQLAAWSEQRHTWALYSKMGASFSGIQKPPPGIVAPYPEFFAGLGKLARQTATALEKAAGDQAFDAKGLATELLEMEKLSRGKPNGINDQELARMPPQLSQYYRFVHRFYAAQTGEAMSDGWKLHRDLDETLKRVSETGQATAKETEILKMYYDTRLFAPPTLRSLSEVCDRLAELARKQLAGEHLTHEEAQWVAHYGDTIAGLQGYDADTWPDEFPIITRIFHDQWTRSVLYAGVARPQALYLILPHKGRLQLYWGAVLSYREFTRPEDQSLDDQSWREVVRQGKAPAPPRFTQSFLRADQPGTHATASFAIPSGLRPGDAAEIELKVTEVSLGPSPTEWVRREGWIRPSEDCRHVAYRARKEAKWRIYRDGEPGREYDEAAHQSFSPDSQHLVYIARQGDKHCVVLDGVEGPGFAGINETTKYYWPFVFSPDSKRLAYVATTENGKQCVVVDGVQGSAFDEVLNHSFSFSDDSKHFAYAGTRGGQGIVIKDGKEVLQSEAVLARVQVFGDHRVGDTFGPFLNADGSRLVCAVRRAGKWVVVDNGQESQPWDEISQLHLHGSAAGFSPDGRQFTYVGIRGEKNFVVVDQKENPDGWFYCALFSPDGKHSAYIKGTVNPQRSVACSVVLDGVPGKHYNGEVDHLVFSPDGKKLAYTVRESAANGYVVIHGGQEFDDYSAQGDIFFSLDSSHIAFLGHKQGRSFFVIDGQEYLKSDDPMRGSIHSDDFTFSPDSKRWGYVSEHDKASYAVISGAEYGPYDFISVPDEEAYIYFSPHSRHFAFMATRDYYRTQYRGRQFLVVDGRDYELQGASWLNGSVLRFDSDTKLHGLIMSTDRISRLEVEIRAK